MGALLVAASWVAAVAWAAPGDIPFKRPEDSAAGAFPPAVFPHWRHRIRFRCDACHNDLFEMQAGANEINMTMIQQGKACGTCHNGKVAFDTTLANCHRCHLASTP